MKKGIHFYYNPDPLIFVPLLFRPDHLSKKED